MKKLLPVTRRHDITFCRSGRIYISAAIAKALNLAPGDSINIAVADGEFLLYAIKATPGARLHARCYPSSKGSHNFRSSSAPLCRALLNAIGVAARQASFPVGEPLSINGVTHIPIITRFML